MKTRWQRYCYVREVDCTFLHLWFVFWKGTSDQVNMSGGFLDELAAERWIDENLSKCLDRRFEEMVLE